MRKIPHGAETNNILVAELDFLEKTVSAFFRLSSAREMGDLTEVPVPTRFVFIIMGPKGFSNKHFQIGRAYASLMADQV